MEISPRLLFEGEEERKRVHTKWVWCRGALKKEKFVPALVNR